MSERIKRPYIMTRVKDGWKFNDGEVSFILSVINVDIKGKGKDYDQYDMLDVLDNFISYQKENGE